MNIQHLRCLIETVRTGSISAAARRLGRSHSTLSSAIASLEADLGLTLLDRSGHKPQLTDDGKRLMPDMVRALQECDHLESVAASLVAGAEHSIRIVFDSTAPFLPVGKAMQDIVKRFQSTEFCFDMCFGDAEQEILAQRADLGIVTRTRSLSSEIGSLTISHNKWGYFCHQDHPLLNHAPEITAKILDNYPNIVLEEVRMASSSLRQIGIRTISCNSPMSLLVMLHNQIGFALMPYFVAEVANITNLTEFTPIDLPGEFKVPSCVVWNPNSPQGPIVSLLIERAKELCSTV